jgi:hypothetical protein
VDHCCGITETYYGIAVSVKFLHGSCVLTFTTSSLFIRFWRMSNQRKAQEVSYELAITSFWNTNASMVKIAIFPMLLQPVSTDMQQRGWRLKSHNSYTVCRIKDYELEVHYHPGKANVVADALSRKHRCNHLSIQSHHSCCDPEEPSLRVVPRGRLNNIALIPTIKEDVITTQKMDVGMEHIRWRMDLGEAQCFWQDSEGVPWFKDRLMVPKNFELHRKIMDRTHCLWYSIHPRTNQMYQDLKKNFWWTRMKREIIRYVSERDTCRRVMANHLRPAGYLQPFSIPEWKWENICMDSIVGLPCTSRGYNSIWVIVDRLTKSTHFIPVSTT